MDFTSLFCDVDDFCKVFEPEWNRKLLRCGVRRRIRKPRLALSELMTIVIAFHTSGFRTFKDYYFMLLRVHRDDFPNLVSYQRFVELTPSTLVPLSSYLMSRRGENTGVGFIDATSLAVCGNKRISRNRVFEGVAEIGRTTMGWFFGFKLHLIINECGELLAVKVTPGNVDDRSPVRDMTKGIFGKLFGDKGYISKALFAELWDEGLQLITSLRKNMKPRLIPLWDRLMLRKRSLIETVNDQLKNIAQVEHTRHRSVANFMVNLLAALVSYTHQPKKPTIRFTDKERRLLGIEHKQQLLIA